MSDCEPAGVEAKTTDEGDAGLLVRLPCLLMRKGSQPLMLEAEGSAGVQRTAGVACTRALLPGMTKLRPHPPLPPPPASSYPSSSS